ncbi:FMN-binding protein [Leifsonia shinshuensis]|uniref:FMN-binding protein n=1 Tax=Leifsonia shinshuensis TaxID=150026 RepID=UPI001F504521|nr:FMN-binding protein [Leifsonia shinshuensis]MCI0158969.1 FMN-binding protein [Leifsonia shinshuensis]
MNSKSWRGTILFTVILVTMGATVGLKLYGVGEQASSAQTSVHVSTSASGTTTSTSPSTTATPDATPTPSATATAPAASAASATKTVTGSAVDTRYGPVQVKVTFSGTTITAVDTVQYPSESGRDVEINSQALPILQQETLSKQSAQIDTVSGATYTSEGYIQSLQSAIDQR